MESAALAATTRDDARGSHTVAVVETGNALRRAAGAQLESADARRAIAAVEGAVAALTIEVAAATGTALGVRATRGPTPTGAAWAVAQEAVVLAAVAHTLHAGAGTERTIDIRVAGQSLAIAARAEPRSGADGGLAYRPGAEHGDATADRLGRDGVAIGR